MNALGTSGRDPRDTVETIVIPVSGILLLVLFFVLFAGCAAPQPVARVETVEVLVPVIEPCPAPPEARRPVLPLAALDSTSTPADVLRAYVSSAWLLAGYAEELEIILGAYRPDTTQAK